MQVHGIKRYNIRSDDLVFDPRYGGRVKWAPALLKGGEVSVRSVSFFSLRAILDFTLTMSIHR